MQPEAENIIHSGLYPFSRMTWLLGHPGLIAESLIASLLVHDQLKELGHPFIAGEGPLSIQYELMLNG